MPGETSVAEGTSVTEASAPTELNVETVLSLQGLTDVSEADLMGPSPTENTTAPSESTGTEESKETTDEQVKDLSTQETEEKSKETTEEKPEPEKPPKGFVPLEAVHEVRGENKFLKAQLAELTAKVAQLSQVAPQLVVPPPEPVVHEFTDFVELTDDEFKALAAEDAPEALVYMKQLNAFHEFQRKTAENARLEEARQEYLNDVFTASNAAMEQAVPGIFDAESPAAKEFEAFAVGLGFTNDMFYLTNPATQIIIPGETEPLLLGEHAAQVVAVLANAMKGSPVKPVDEAALRATIRRELEGEILQKLKTGQDFRSLSNVPQATTEVPEKSVAILSEAQFAKLSSAEQELYLAGQ